MFAGVGLLLVGTQGGMVQPVTSRLGETGTIRLGLLLDAAGFALLSVAGSWPMLGGALAFLAVGQGLLTPTLSSAVAGAAPPGRAGAALGVQQSAGGLARVVGPAAGGALFALAVPAPYLVAAVLAVAALPLTFGRDD